jgi:lysophospholipase L1-like esterase
MNRALAAECAAAFLEAGKFIKSSSGDGIHLESEDHRKLGQAVAEAVKNLF